MKSELLPIGSVVLLEGGTKAVMINGYKMKEKIEEDKIYDYVGCVFPEGFMEQIYVLFDANQIKDVLFVGCMDGVEEYLKNIENGVVNVPVSSLPGGAQISVPAGKRGARRKAPTKPLSISEMRAKYTKQVISGGQSKIFDIDAYLAEDHSQDNVNLGE